MLYKAEKAAFFLLAFFSVKNYIQFYIDFRGYIPYNNIGGKAIPTICQFYGIIILMHLTRKEHNPPHIHAYYGEYEAQFLIETGEKMYGDFPSSGCELVKKFVLQYKDELKEMWDTEVYKKLPPID